MANWNRYEDRVKMDGATQRESYLRREQRMLSCKLKDSLSYHTVLIDGVARDAAIINSDNLNEKTLFSMPGETISCGSMVEWADNRWLIVEKDANTEVYTRVKLLQCNYLLKWVDKDDLIHEQWCVIEDGTKYLTGEYEDRSFVTTRGDARIAMTIGRNADTAKLGRGNRFLIDDPDHEKKTAFLLTKPLRAGKTYNTEGIFSFVLQEVVSTDDDNMELCIADYYKHFPKKKPSGDTNNNNTSDTGKKVWL